MRPRGQKRPPARQETIRRIIQREQVKNGRAPTPEEIARVLACSVVRVRKHLAEIERRDRQQLSLTPTTEPDDAARS